MLLNLTFHRNIRFGALALWLATCDFGFYKAFPAAHRRIWLSEAVGVFS
jgi:hypothetical protein